MASGHRIYHRFAAGGQLYRFIYCLRGNIFSWQHILAIGMVNYTYKFIMAIALTPLIYLMERRIEKYFGHALTHQMKQSAMGKPLVDEEPVVAG